MKKSILQETKECYVCREYLGVQNLDSLERHHVISGVANRQLSEKYGLTLWLCHEHHNESPMGVHFNKALRDQLCRFAQHRFQEEYPEKNFRQLFGKTYL